MVSVVEVEFAIKVHDDRNVYQVARLGLAVGDVDIAGVPKVVCYAFGAHTRLHRKQVLDGYISDGRIFTLGVRDPVSIVVLVSLRHAGSNQPRFERESLGFGQLFQGLGRGHDRHNPITVNAEQTPCTV